MKVAYYRQSRTASSEQYQLMDGSDRVGHLDLHFGLKEVFATLVLDRDFAEDDILRMIEQLDEDLVISAEVPRDDLLVRVYVGREVGLYSDEMMRDEFMNGESDSFEPN